MKTREQIEEELHRLRTSLSALESEMEAATRNDGPAGMSFEARQVRDKIYATQARIITLEYVRDA